MLALYDHPALQLPYVARAYWPLVERNGQPDWIEAVDSVNTWLLRSIGPHYLEWCWHTWPQDRSDRLAVSFRRERSCTLFLLAYDR